MIQFTATIEKFASKGEKTGWSYIVVTAKQAQQLVPGTKQSFRVKGTLDAHKIKQASLIPMGEGNFILPVNGTMRKALHKQKGATVAVAIEPDFSPIKPSADLMECLREEPAALKKFKSMPHSHQNYYTKWIESAKTEPTKTKRIALTVDSMLKGWDFGQMLRAERAKKEELKR